MIENILNKKEIDDKWIMGVGWNVILRYEGKFEHRGRTQNSEHNLLQKYNNNNNDTNNNSNNNKCGQWMMTKKFEPAIEVVTSLHSQLHF